MGTARNRLFERISAAKDISRPEPGHHAERGSISPARFGTPTPSGPSSSTRPAADDRGVSVAFVLYLAYHVLALALALWAVVSASRSIPEHRAAHRAWALLAGMLTPLALLVAALSVPLGHPGLRALGVLLPLLTVAGTAASVVTLSGQGFALRLVHLPVLLWNGALAGVYAIRVTQEAFGIDCGTAGTALVAGHAFLQQQVGDPGADSQPLWLHLPLFAPLWLRYQWTHRLALGAASLTATAMLGVFALSMPLAWERAETFRAPRPAGLRAEPDWLGLTVPWLADAAGADEATLRDRRAGWLGLPADVLAFTISPDDLLDEARLAHAQAEIEHARADGRRVIARVVPPAQLRRRPVRDVEALRAELAKTHWLCAERLAPDVVVLFEEPYGALRDAVAQVGTVEDWMAVIRRAAEETRQANPRVATAVTLGNRAPHARLLFERLAGVDSPVDAVGLSLHAEALPPGDVEDALHVWSDWFATDHGPRPVWMLGVGTCPATSGGELGQWNFLARVLEFAGAEPRVQGVCIDTLVDGSEMRGLMTPEGRTRHGWRELRRLVAEPEDRPETGAAPLVEGVGEKPGNGTPR